MISLAAQNTVQRAKVLAIAFSLRTRSMSEMGLGRVKTPTSAARRSILEKLHVMRTDDLPTRNLISCWRIVFSTFFQCMSFYTASVISNRF